MELDIEVTIFDKIENKYSYNLKTKASLKDGLLTYYDNKVFNSVYVGDYIEIIRKDVHVSKSRLYFDSIGETLISIDEGEIKFENKIINFTKKSICSLEYIIMSKNEIVAHNVLDIIERI